ncbi:DUF4233 domain-containing protein [Nesterenkonia sp. PF2B19]|uniref:DUF4233 domain-containing protein n=1 Tax=Nesterenkonia sp. PF2B19 TaxID=1881858 RepID=UPI000A19CAA5|nr:DUF4233 domain-containing protein [Nesterenkonia sp. PF2B19]OSM44498.1 hypothetical protein BCY76_002045 [Nesterenkonia sp. PF2B19]
MTAQDDGDRGGRPRRQTRAQREWRPGMTRPPRSVRVMFGSAVLSLEALLMFFFGLMVWGLHQNEWYAWWLFGGSLGVSVLLILTCALLKRPVGWWLGWILQFIILAGGLVEPYMYFVGVLFLACWWYAVVKGRQLDVEKMERWRAEERLAAEQEPSPPENDHTHHEES